MVIIRNNDPFLGLEGGRCTQVWLDINQRTLRVPVITQYHSAPAKLCCFSKYKFCCCSFGTPISKPENHVLSGIVQFPVCLVFSKVININTDLYCVLRLLRQSLLSFRSESVFPWDLKDLLQKKAFLMMLVQNHKTILLGTMLTKEV
jgi:hypothetical protein